MSEYSDLNLIDNVFVDLIKIDPNNKVSIIIPTRDQELIFWSKNKNYFKKNNIDVLVSDRKYLDICLILFCQLELI